MSDTNTGHYIVKPAIVGAVGALASSWYYGPASTFSIGGKDIPLWAAMGITIGLSSVATEFVHEKIFPLVGPTDRLSTPVASAVSVGVGAAASSALLTINDAGNVGEFGLGPLLALSAVSEIAGDYAYTHFGAPLLLGQNSM
jgi:hypothetical protein